MEEHQIDEKLYSRQLYTYGKDAMKNMSNKSILISGLGGTGVEIAKNVILCGVNSVTIHDTENVTMNDLCSQFYLNEESIGKNRAFESLEKLSELNPYVSVSASEDELTNDFVKRFNCVILTNPIPYSKIFSLSKFCHENSIAFILAMSRGVFGFVYNDFGLKFTVEDPLQKQPSRFLIDFVTNDKEGIVTVNSDYNLMDLNINNNSFVTFDHVQGMVELNEKEFPIKFIDSRSFSIGDTSQFHPYDNTSSSGYCRQLIKPRTMEFQELNEALHNPCFNDFDQGFLERQPQVIISFFSLFKSIEEKDVSIENMLKNANIINDEFKLAGKIDEDLVREFLREDAVISPTASIIGGMAGQEAIKSVTYKFIPLQMFFTFSDLEALQPINDPSFHTTIKNDRYDGYRLVFGDKQFRAIAKLRYFMVGAGAIGCELLKNWSMMGVGTIGRIYLTDNDTIEKSNLNRQFLFHDEDIRKYKSVCAAEAVKVMNPDIKITAHINKVEHQSEEIYNYKFYNILSGICNALDNYEARKYNDNQAIYYRKPLLESGTDGPLGKVEFYIPGLTNSYQSSNSPSKNGYLPCVVHETPSSINHCIVWAREQFEGYFKVQPSDVNELIKKEHQWSNTTVLFNKLKMIKKILVDDRATSYEGIVKIARLQFEEIFSYNIKDLTHELPKNSKKEDNTPYWSGKNRFPTPHQYDAKNDLHAAFIRAATKLFGIRNKVQLTEEQIENSPEVAQSIEVPAWQPPDNKDQNINESEPDNNIPKTEEKENKIEQACSELLESIKPFENEENLLVVQEFDREDQKDIDFIVAATNLRAENYKINTGDEFSIKKIVGDITPAIATTTAIVCGLVSIGMYKVHSVTPKDLFDYKNASINLSNNRNMLYSPARTDVHTVVVKNAEGEVTNEYKCTFWDKWIIEGDLTMREFMDAFKKKFNLTVVDLIINGHIFTLNFDKFADRKITDLYQNHANCTLIPGKLIPLTLYLKDDNNNKFSTDENENAQEVTTKIPMTYLKYF